jgi:hypothetical protein
MKNFIISLFVLSLVSFSPAQKSILFLAGAGQESGGPKESDDLVIDMLDARGYDVEYLYLDNPSLMTEDLGLDKDLVVVSSTILSTHIGNFYMDKAVPVLTWETGMYPKLGIATGGLNINISETVMSIVADDHPALGAYTGDVEVILNSPQELSLTDTLNLCPGTQILTEIVSDDGTPMAAIYVVEEGDSLLDNMTAPARRLSYFFRDETALNATDEAMEIFALCAMWTMGDEVNSVEELKRAISYKLLNNYPNPFNPATNICFELPATKHVSLVVYNAMGQQVKTLVSGIMSPGSHSITWNGTNDFGNRVPSGIYFYKLTTPDNSMVHKMTLVK